MINSRFQSGLPVNILRGITPTATLWDGQVGFAYMSDEGTGFTDETTDANSAGAGDVAIFPAVPANNDAFYIGENFSTSAPFNSIKWNISTALTAGTIIAEYYNGSAWVSLTLTTDETVLLTVTGSKYMKFDEPADWAAVAVNGQSRYWVRFRVTDATAMNQPLATQIWLGRYPTSLANTTDGSMTTVSGTGTVLLGAAGDSGYLTYDLASSKRVLVSARVGVWSSANISKTVVGFSTDGTTFYEANLAVDAYTSTTEIITDMYTRIGFGRYIRLRFNLSGGGTAFDKTYSVSAYEMGV